MIMETTHPAFETLAFLDYELSPYRRRLLRDGRTVAIGGRAFDLLALFAQHPGEVLSNRLLMQAVWPHTIVVEANVRAQVMLVRKLLGGDDGCPTIVNVTGRGYCFTAPVRRLPARQGHAFA
jgi:DNA-binding winged helix-turn-helix (wHTH) protein